MNDTGVVEKVTALARPIVEQLGYELVDVEYVKEGKQWFLRLFIDHPRGITLDDCEAVSKKTGIELDVHDPIPHSYVLEVSSPGLERPLKREEDYRRFAGRKITINTYAPVYGKKVHTGKLVGLIEDEVVLGEEHAELRIPRKAIANAHLTIEF
ncbi:ribosome maturation factor RimP [Clostridiales bacterium PH28_bin88]|nr:ribosome maturation factor RimP [Clostridiales bacterium PH28_bin88]